VPPDMLREDEIWRCTTAQKLLYFLLSLAEVAELVDAHDSGSCARKCVEVRVLSSALYMQRRIIPSMAIPMILRWACVACSSPPKPLPACHRPSPRPSLSHCARDISNTLCNRYQSCSARCGLYARGLFVVRDTEGLRGLLTCSWLSLL
jgi:hypothetical protein